MIRYQQTLQNQCVIKDLRFEITIEKNILFQYASKNESENKIEKKIIHNSNKKHKITTDTYSMKCKVNKLYYSIRVNSLKYKKGYDKANLYCCSDAKIDQ